MEKNVKGLPITVVASSAPANLEKVTADFLLYWIRSEGVA